MQAVPEFSLPELPPNARYVHHANECYDWGTFGWLLLESGHVRLNNYKYFFFINSSVRGPFLPAYARVSATPLAHNKRLHACMHWWDSVRHIQWAGGESAVPPHNRARCTGQSPSFTGCGAT